MALGEIRRHYRIEALTTAAEMIEQHAGTDAMLHLPEAEADVFAQECQKIADKLKLMAKSLGM